MGGCSQDRPTGGATSTRTAAALSPREACGHRARHTGAGELLQLLLLPKAYGLRGASERKPGPDSHDDVPPRPYLLGSAAWSPFSLVTMTL